MMLIGGCKSVEGDFPSLAKRPFESANPAAAPVPAETPVATTLPAEMERAVTGLVQRHQKAQDQYIALLPGVKAQAARAAGSAMGSEMWVSAHLALSRLDRARADSVAALAELDALIEKQLGDEVSGSATLIPLLEPKQRLLVAAVAEQSSELDRLANQIGL
jgi:hypothetical protein